MFLLPRTLKAVFGSTYTGYILIEYSKPGFCFSPLSIFVFYDTLDAYSYFG